MRLPDIVWTCACTVVDPHDNEWEMYLDVEASTKGEAEQEAVRICGARGVAATDVVVMPCPERRVSGTGRSVPALPPPPEVVEPFFEKAYFTKYMTTTQIASGG